MNEHYTKKGLEKLQPQLCFTAPQNRHITNVRLIYDLVT
jgi:hypothetical protein